MAAPFGEKRNCMLLLDELIAGTRKHVLKRLWVISDLQQRYPDRATKCMTTAVSDFLDLGLSVDAICYLGDATEGDDPDYIHQMTEMQEHELSKIEAPIYYTVGNHDFDYFRAYHEKLGRMCLPFVEYVRQFPQWHMPESISEMAYKVDFGEFVAYFLTDHADPSGSWFTSHGVVRGNEEAYPYTPEDYRKLMDQVAREGKPVITFSHYSFAGGNRAAPLFDQFLPLPDNLRIHFYGHAHIGDHVWAGKDCHRKIACVDNQPIMQIDVASLESGRGSAIRSIMLEWYDTHEIGILFRNHSLHCWDNLLINREGDGSRVEPYRN